MSHITTVALLVFLTIHAGSSEGCPGTILRCCCLSTESRPIGRHIGVVEVRSPNAHCNQIEIIATLKKNGKRVCLDPNASWVQRVLKHLGETP